MPILPYVEHLAVADQQALRAALLAILHELAYPFVLYPEQIENYSPQNIVVRLGHTTPRLVLGAHYGSNRHGDSAPDGRTSLFRKNNAGAKA